MRNALLHGFVSREPGGQPAVPAVRNVRQLLSPVGEAITKRPALVTSTLPNGEVSVLHGQGGSGLARRSESVVQQRHSRLNIASDHASDAM